MTIEPLTPFSPYTRLTRAEWARLRADAALTLTPEDVLRLQGLNERLAMDEVVAVYLNAFSEMNEVNWPNLKTMLESDKRLQLGG